MHLLVVIIALCGLLLGNARGQEISGGSEEIAIAESLARRIVDPAVPGHEVQDFVSRRVASVPAFRTALEWQAFAFRQRQDVLEHVVFRGEANAWRDTPVEVEWLDTIETSHGYRIRKLRYTALPGRWIPALLYEPMILSGTVPVNLAVNGHDPLGKAATYKQIRCINLVKRGMLVLNVEWLGMGQLRLDEFDHGRMNQIDLCGTSGLAPFFLAMRKGLDVLLDHPAADETRVSVAGLSGGGWQTIVLGALDPRVTLCNPVAGYSSLHTRLRHVQDLGDSEQTPVDLATFADYTSLTAMLAPRPALLTYNASDECCFRAEHALPPLVEAARPVYELFGRGDFLRTHVNHEPGTHNFEQENREALYRMLGDHFFPGTAFDARERTCNDEIRTPEDLHVALPTKVVGFHTLANELARDLPRGRELPCDRDEAIRWLENRRERLATLTRYRHEDVHAVAEGNARAVHGGFSRSWWLRVGGAWTVPATEFFSNIGDGSSLLFIADDGRSSIPPASIRRALGHHGRVVAIDPLFIGESRMAERDHLFALQVSCVGERPLGVQATQIAAVARWLAGPHGIAPVHLVAIGPRASLASLVAAGLEPDAIDEVTTHEPLPSLKRVLQRNLTFAQGPEYFCFGLLNEFDMAQIAALVAPRRLTFVGTDEELRRTISPLLSWFSVHGGSGPTLQQQDDLHAP